jgi:heat shock protein HspQ
VADAPRQLGPGVEGATGCGAHREPIRIARDQPFHHLLAAERLLDVGGHVDVVPARRQLLDRRLEVPQIRPVTREEQKFHVGP